EDLTASPETTGMPEGTGTSKSGKVAICHATGSQSNPYVRIVINQSALDAHRAHGDIVPAPPGGCPGAGTPVPTFPAISTDAMTPSTPSHATAAGTPPANGTSVPPGTSIPVSTPLPGSTPLPTAFVVATFTPV